MSAELEARDPCRASGHQGRKSEMKSYCSSAQLHFMDTVLEKGYPPRRFDWRSVSRLTVAGCVTFQEVKFRNGEVGGKYVVLPKGVEQLRLAGWRS